MPHLHPNTCLVVAGKLNGEFRYLTPVGEGKLAGEYLGRDRYDEYTSDSRKRHYSIGTILLFS